MTLSVTNTIMFSFDFHKFRQSCWQGVLSINIAYYFPLICNNCVKIVGVLFRFREKKKKRNEIEFKSELKLRIQMSSIWFFNGIVFEWFFPYFPDLYGGVLHDEHYKILHDGSPLIDLFPPDYICTTDVDYLVRNISIYFLQNHLVGKKFIRMLQSHPYWRFQCTWYPKGQMFIVQQIKVAKFIFANSQIHLQVLASRQ